MAIYEITSSEIVALEETSFSANGIRERYDLQRLLREKIGVIAPGTLVIAEEFGDWEDSRRRIDLLALDSDANIVVVELKTTEDGGHMELQAIRYAAMVSTMTFDRVVETFGAHLRRQGRTEDPRDEILSFLGWETPDEGAFGQDVRIVLASAEFSRELTTAVLWLNEQGLNIRCVRLKPYRHEERVLLDVQQVIPLPEAAEYQVRIRDKERRGRQERAERQDVRRSFWEGLLDVANPKTSLHANISPSDANWISTSSGLRGLTFAYVTMQSSSRVELYIDRVEEGGAQNKRIFDQLHQQREVIEASFGQPLLWERLDERRACRISYSTQSGGYRSPMDEWSTHHAELADAMIRLEAALRPHLQRLQLA